MTLTKCFKEWAVVCEALASGRQIVILRKGGLLEERSGFTLEAEEFLLFPSTLHQNPEGVIPEARGLLKASEPILTHVARVEAARKIVDLQALSRLRPFHIYSDSLLAERFHRWQDAGVHALIVRVKKLARPVPVPAAKEYEGCKSWFDLKFAVETTGGVPVLSDEAFGSLYDGLTQSWSGNR